MQVANNSNNSKQATQQPTTNTQYTSQESQRHSSNTSPQRQQYQHPTSQVAYAAQRQNRQQQYQQSPRNIYPQQPQKHGYVSANPQIQNSYPQQVNMGSNSVVPNSAPNEVRRRDDGNKYAIAALISGIIAFLTGVTVLGGFLFGAAAFILAHKRSKQYKQCYGSNEPINIAMTLPSKAKERIARVLGIIGIFEAIAVLIFCSFFIDTFTTTLDDVTADIDVSGYTSESNVVDETVNATTEGIALSTVDGTIADPAEVGEWLTSTIYLSDSDTYEMIYYRITSVDTNDESVQAVIDEYNADDGSYYTIEAIGGDYSDDLHYITITYELYIPSTLSIDNGISVPDLSFTILGTDGGALKADGYTYQGLNGTDITVDAPALLYAGETYVGTYVFAAPTAATDALVQSAAEDEDGSTTTTNTLIDLTVTTIAPTASGEDNNTIGE